MATAGLMTCFNGFRNQRPHNKLQTVKGIPQEIVMELARLGETTLDVPYEQEPRNLIEGDLPYALGFDPEILKYVALKMLKEAGVRLMLHTHALTLRKSRLLD